MTLFNWKKSEKGNVNKILAQFVTQTDNNNLRRGISINNVINYYSKYQTFRLYIRSFAINFSTVVSLQVQVFLVQ